MLAGFLKKRKQLQNNKINTDVEHSQNLSTWISQVFQFVFMFRMESPRPRREHRPNCTKPIGVFDFMQRLKNRLPPDKSNAFWLEHLSDFDRRCSCLTITCVFKVPREQNETMQPPRSGAAVAQNHLQDPG